MQSTAAVPTSGPGRVVSLEIEFPALLFPSNYGILRLDNVPYPFSQIDLARLAEDAGYAKPAFFNQLRVRERYRITVTNGESQSQVGHDGFINIDQPLLHYYHQNFVPAFESGRGTKINATDGFSSTAVLCHDNEFIDMGGVRISLRRTIRIPDNEKKHLLPPNMGAFELYNVADYADQLPRSVVSKGGLFIAMYQREALWIQFSKSSAAHAVKVSVGDVNALTGLPRNQPAPQGKQDYAAVKNVNGQIWLDGVSVAPGLVRQFVAMPLGEGYTVEGQITGKEDVGGLQFDVFNEYPKTALFTSEDNNTPLSLYMTPRKLGLKPGSTIYMEALRQPLTSRKLGLKPGLTIYMEALRQPLTSNPAEGPRLLDIHVELKAHPKQPEPGEYFFVKTLTGKILVVPSESMVTVTELKEFIHASEGIPCGQQRLIFGGRQLQDQQTLKAYSVTKESMLYLVLPLRGGGAPNLGLAAGGSISQKIIRDNLPPLAYNLSTGKRVHVSIINAAHFPSITGLPAPPTPVSTQTYLNSGLPWFKMYEEDIPSANNTTAGGALAGVKSLATMDRERTEAGQSTSTQQGCGFCSYEMATLRLLPCGHVLCDDCADGISVDKCTACPRRVTSRQRFAAQMRLPGQEDGDGVDALSFDERIVALKRVARTNQIISFKLREHDVSALSGEIRD